MTPWRRLIQSVAADPALPVLPWLAPGVFRPWPEVVGKRVRKGTGQERRHTTQTKYSDARHATLQTNLSGQKRCYHTSSPAAQVSRIARHRHSSCIHGQAGKRHLSHATIEGDSSPWLQAITGRASPGYPRGGTTPNVVPQPHRMQHDDGLRVQGVGLSDDHALDTRTARARERIVVADLVGEYRSTIRNSRHRRLFGDALLRLQTLVDEQPQDVTFTRRLKYFPALAKRVIERYEAYVKQMAHYKMVSFSRARSRHLSISDHSYVTRTLDTQASSSVAGNPAGSKQRSSPPEAAAGNDDVDAWKMRVARLRSFLQEAENNQVAFSEIMNLPADAKVWYDLANDIGEGTTSWDDLVTAAHRTVLDQQRQTLRARVGLQPRQLSSNGFIPNDYLIIKALESAIWQDARERLLPLHSTPLKRSAFTQYVRQTVLLYGLTHEPRAVPDTLSRLSSTIKVSRSMIADTLEVLIAWAQKHVTDNRLWWLDLGRVISALSPAEAAPLQVSGPALSTIIRHLPHQAIPMCLESWQNSGIHVPGNTILHAVDLLAKGGQAEEAVALLKTAITSIGNSASSSAVHSVFTTVLRTAANLPDSLRICQDLVTQAVEHGFVPDLQVFNVIMLNAVEVDDTKFAFDVYHSLQSSGLQPDGHTFAVLAKACKSRHVDQRQITRLIDDGLRSGVLLSNPTVAAEVLHALSLHHMTQRPDEAYGLIVEAYGQLFNDTVLEHAGLIQRRNSRDTESGKLSPGPAVLGIMLQAYLKVGKPDPAQALAVYRRIRDLARYSKQPYVDLIKDTRFWNGFVAFFGAHKETVQIALEVVQAAQDMALKADSQDTTVAIAITADKPVQGSDFAGLDISTLSIALDMLSKHSNTQNDLLPAARRMVEFMLTRHQVDARSLVALARAYLRQSDLAGGQWCIDQLESVADYDKTRAASVLREVEAAKKRLAKQA